VNRTVFYTDGACINNGSADASGGMGIYQPDTRQSVSVCWGGLLEGLFGLPTNNKCELWAAGMAIRMAEKFPAPEVEIFSDSTYVVEGINHRLNQWIERGWRKQNSGKPPANLEMWKTIHQYIEKSTKKITLTHVRGHTGVHGNEVADQLAESAAIARGEGK